MKGQRRIGVDIGDLGWAREDCYPDHVYYVDLRTGEVLPAEWDEPDVRVGRGIRCLEVPKPEPGEGYRDMVDFIDTVTDPTRRAMLSVAIRGAGAFRRFKDVLLGFPEEREGWFEFKNELTRERLEGWLGDEGVEVEWTGSP